MANDNDKRSFAVKLGLQIDLQDVDRVQFDNWRRDLAETRGEINRSTRAPRKLAQKRRKRDDIIYMQRMRSTNVGAITLRKCPEARIKE